MTRRLLYGFLAFCLLGFALGIVLTQPRPGSTADLAGLTGQPGPGEMVFLAAGCGNCHMAPDAKGEARLILSGGQRFASPFGTFLAPNISPDPDHGIGGWTLKDFACAVRDGVSPDGQHYFPAMPFGTYNKMTGQDLADLKAFMDQLPPSAVPSLAHEVGFPFNIRRAIGGWKLLFASQDWQLAVADSPELARGRYLVEAVAHCTECHTPRNFLGGLDRGRWLAGAPNPDGKGRTPNITPAKLSWSAAEILAYLTTGFTPEFDSVGGHMALVVDSMARLPESDVRAIVTYLKAIPPAE